jgi:hypothetical protein
MKEIHMVKMMKIIVCTKRTISGSLGKPKNLLPLEVECDKRRKIQTCNLPQQPLV